MPGTQKPAAVSCFLPEVHGCKACELSLACPAGLQLMLVLEKALASKGATDQARPLKVRGIRRGREAVLMAPEQLP